MSDKRRTFAVIDGNSLMHRAFHAVPPTMNAPDGRPTNAIFGFLNMFLKMIDAFNPDGVVVAFDKGKPRVRMEMLPQYKAQRPPMDLDLHVQFPMIKELLGALNVPILQSEGWEGDDILGTMARLGEEAGCDMLLVTGDRDMYQLVTEHVNVVSTRKGLSDVAIMTPESVDDLYHGITPALVPDFYGLKGDTSDNIPGVPGVGEKTAMKLLHENGTLEAIYDRLDDESLNATPGVKKKLAAGRESAFQSYDLCTIHRDAPLEFDPEENVTRPVNAAPLRALFQQLGFTKLISQMGLEEAEAPVQAQASCSGVCSLEQVTTAARWQELIAQWQGQCVPVLALPELAALAVCWGENGSQAAIFRESETEDYPGFLHALFRPEITKLGYHIKDVMRWALARGLTAEGFVFDAAIAAYLLAPTDGSYALDKVAGQYFTEDFPPEKDYLGSKAWKDAESAAKAMGTMASHAALIAALYAVLPGKLEELGLTRVYTELELPLCPVLAEMEQAGMLVDLDALTQFGEQLKTGIAALQGEIWAMAGQEFNLNSTQQLGKVLFEDMGLPPVKKTKTGYSTSAEVLEKLRAHHPIIDCILEYRQLTKLNSTYVEGLSKVIAPDGRVHTCFQNTVTATGRLSSTEPNLQNIPVRTELGAQIRNMFIARPGWVLVDADYSQIELRLLAHMAGDEKMIESFRAGEDIHAHTAAQVFGLPQEQVTPELRRRAKAVNFGIVYGISGFSLAQDIGVSRKEASEYMEKYLETFSGVRDYMARIKAQAKADGYVATLMGRRRWLPELKSSNFNLRAFGERVALNMPIQGTAADVMKLAMIRVAARLKAEGLQAQLILQVHDELIVECPQDEEAKVKEILTQEMEGAGNFSVPLIADANAGHSWAEAKG